MSVQLGVESLSSFTGIRTPESFVQALLDGKRTFTDALVSQIENRLGLPEGTIDSHKA
jgi:hypothetical protein